MSDAVSWTEEDSETYRSLARIAVPRREGQIAALLTLLPFEQTKPFRAVELGAGEGVLSHALLGAFPQSTLTALDGSASMRDRARALLEPFRERVRIEAFDLAATDWHDRLEAADAVLSSLAIHHLDGPGKQHLFGAVARRLAPGGAFLVIDLVEPQRAEAQGFFAESWDHDAQSRSRGETGSDGLFEAFQAAEWNYYRHPDPADRPSALFDQLQWLHAAGLTEVDCFWMHAGHAVYGGYKSPAPSGASIRSLSYVTALEGARKALAGVEA